MSDAIIFSCPACGRPSEDDFCQRDGTRIVRCVATDTKEIESRPQESVAVSVSSANTSVQPPHFTEAKDATGQSQKVSPGPQGITDLIQSEDSLEQAAKEKLQGIFERMGIRMPKKRAAEDPEGAEAQCKDSCSPKADHFILPPEVAEGGWAICGNVVSTPALDRWPVEMRTSSGITSGFFNRYRSGTLTSRSAYARLLTATTPVLARVWMSGTADFGGARADFDVTSLPVGYGQSLAEYLATSSPSEKRALFLLPGLVKLLETLAALQLQPIVLEPSILIITDAGDLCLMSVGAMAIANLEEPAGEALPEYRPEFARTALLPFPWVAPEVTQQTILTTNAHVFSAGQLLAAAVFGDARTYAEIQAGEVQFPALTDSRLSRALMGSIWPKTKGRWDLETLSAAVTCPLEDLPEVEAWDSIMPGTASTSFSLGGKEYWRLENILGAAVQPQNWDECLIRLNSLLSWIEQTSWAGLAAVMLEALAAGRSTDWVLIRLAHTVRPDAPLTWRDLDLSDGEVHNSFVALAQGALLGNQNEIKSMHALFKVNLRESFSSRINEMN